MFEDYIVKGGIGWMLPIIALSIVSLALSMERGYYWFCFLLKTRHAYKKEIKQMSPASFNLEESIDRTARSSNRLTQAIHIFLRALKQTNIERAEQLANHEIEQIVAETKTGIDVLVFIANVSGTLGLLGTVVGVSMAMESVGLDDPIKLTSSLSIALYTTIAGVLLFVFSYFSVFVYSKFSDLVEGDLYNQINQIKSKIQKVQLY